MSSSTEWSQVESSMEEMAPSSADLFDGDILGDELMDIYNAAVVGGGDDDDGLNEIPSLLGNTDEIHKDGHAAAMDMDDGFGTFRPSTSFNDLAALAAASVVDPPSVASEAAPLAPVVSSASLEPSSGTKAPMPTAAAAAGSATTVVVKRKAAANGADGSAVKRRNSSGGRKTPGGSASSKKKGVAKAAGTPNPLISLAATETAAAVAAAVAAPLPPLDVASSTVTTKIAPVKPCANGVAPPPAVVTPPTTAPEQPATKTTTATVTAVAATTTTTTGTMPTAISKVDAPNAKSVANPVVPAPVTSAASAVAVPTEADFKGVAQAAVNNLILNAGGDKGTGAETKTPLPNEKVDTSSEHIKALTGSNWVSVCGGGDVGGDSGGSEAKNVPVTAQQSADQQNKARRQNLTADERARQNRDRNREHARNTRLRKKAYVEELKRTLTALVNQRDSAATEKRHSAQRELEQREVRFRVLEEFLKLRGRNEANPARWAAIFEENMTLTLPVTDFRGMVRDPASGEGGNTIHEQVVTGVPEIMQDSAHCAAFLQGLGQGQAGGTAVTLQYNCDRKNFFMDSCTAMLEFTATTVGAMEQGAMAEITIKGNARAKFSPASNKLIAVTMIFDTGIIMSQINNLVAQSVDVDADAVAAQEAANEADAILDSLQMPHIEPPSIPAKINVVPLSSGSTTGSDADKGDSSDDDKDDMDEDTQGMSTRRVLRRKV